MIYSYVMREVVFSFLIAIFLANIFIVSAWAKPCLNGGDMMMKQTQSSAQIPCEDMQHNQDQKPDGNNQHCEGICLCLHVSVQQSTTLTKGVSMPLPIITAANYSFSDDVIVNIPSTTIKRPPRA